MIEVEQNKHAKRLLMAARKLGDGWLQAPDHQDMRVQLQALFSEDYFDALMAAEFPLFLGQKLEGLDRQAGDGFVDKAYERGLMLSDGAAVPLLRRLRGIRLDVLRELAIYCDCPKLDKMIDDLEPEPQTAQATTGNTPRVERHTTKGKRSDTLTPVIEHAQSLCKDQKQDEWDTAGVWGKLHTLTAEKYTVLLHLEGDAVVYTDGDNTKKLTKKKLGDRLRGMRQRLANAA